MYHAEKISLTKEGYAKYKNEYENLQKRQKEIIGEVKIYREMGDLSENGAYTGAKSQLRRNENRLQKLAQILRFAQIIENTNTGVIRLGSQITVKVHNEMKKYHLVSHYEANPSNGKISENSPIGHALKGKKAHDIVTISIPTGKVVYEILTIE